MARAIEETVRVLNGESGDPEASARFDALDRLLDAQSYRLSSFRTAGEEINYRRFFAINELAAVRQEVPGGLRRGARPPHAPDRRAAR